MLKRTRGVGLYGAPLKSVDILLYFVVYSSSTRSILEYLLYRYRYRLLAIVLAGILAIVLAIAIPRITIDLEPYKN